MVFHDIEKISDVLNDQRIIIYYILSKNETDLCYFVEKAMEMLQKKNDDIVIFRVLQDTVQFNKFKEIYKPVISGPVALFVINNKGIPMVCKEITEQQYIPDAFETICSVCKLNRVSVTEMKNLINNKSKTTSNENVEKTIDDKIFTNEGKLARESTVSSSYQSLSITESLTVDHSIVNASSSTVNTPSSTVNASSSIVNESNLHVVNYSSTKLQIRLPDGKRDNQKFDKDAPLQEVYDFIKTKYKIINFDMKTYNHQIFAAEDYQKTLEELDLIPSGVIIVVHRSVSFNNNGGVSNIFFNKIWIFLARTTSIFHYLQGMFFVFWNSFFSARNVGPSQNGPASQESGSARETHFPNGTKKSVGVYKQFGNIHTLRRSDDSDDENNRYNGNSTQQK